MTKCGFQTPLWGGGRAGAQARGLSHTRGPLCKGTWMIPMDKDPSKPAEDQGPSKVTDGPCPPTEGSQPFWDMTSSRAGSLHSLP